MVIALENQWISDSWHADDGRRWHLFDTGSTDAELGLTQRIGHPTSTDLHNWQRVGGGPVPWRCRAMPPRCRPHR